MSERAVYVVDGARTPFLKARGRRGAFSASDLATQCGKQLLARAPFAPEELDEVILGCAAPAADEVNIGRVAALRMGCGLRVPGWTVMRNCASGMQAIDSAASDIRCGRSHLVLAGGVDALSRVPLMFSDEAVDWLSGWYGARKALEKLAAAAKFRPRMAAPVIALMKGLTDPVCGLMMGQTAENLASRFGISRAAQDACAVEGHRRLARAQAEGRLREILALFDEGGRLYAADDGVRADSSIEKLAKLKPFFDRYGTVTAGNSSQITDGAVWLILADEEAIARHRLEPCGRIVDTQWAGLDPAQMGLGPVHAATPLLARHGLGLADIDCWEINEAFAAQVLACLAAWKDARYCEAELGCAGALGEIDPARLNADGGAIALGHPVGASGARIVLHTLEVLEREGGKRGVAAICIGGGLGGAMLVEAAA